MELHCRRCTFKTCSAANYLKHQAIHTLDVRFMYDCPLCSFKAQGRRSLESHISVHRKDFQQPSYDQTLAKVKCSHPDCNSTVASAKALIEHLKSHFKDEAVVDCPFGVCRSNEKPNSWVTSFGKREAFTKHIRRYHTNPAVPQELTVLPTASSSDEFASTSADSGQWTVDPPEEDDGELFQAEQVCDFIAKFYLLLEGDLYVPSSSVQTICDQLQNIVQFSHAIMKKTMLQELSRICVKDEEAKEAAHMVFTSDPMFMIHNVNHGQVCLISEHRRYKFYEKHFNFVEPEKKEVSVEFVPIASSPQPIKKHKPLSVVSLKISLATQLQDPHVKVEVKASLQKLQSGYYSTPVDKDDKIYRDFTDGEVFRNHPASKKPCLYLLFSCDGFGVTDALGSAKGKHKSVGLYYVLGNLPPEKRSKVDVLQLSTLFLDEHLKVTQNNKKAAVKERKLRWDQCLKPVIEELQYLFETGIEFEGSNLPVYALTMLGDNLGQHQIGGFSELFTGEYFCRFCDISKEEFTATPNLQKAFRTKEEYDQCVEAASKQKKLISYKGVKFNSVLNEIPGFHVTQPALAPCIAHDLLEGWASADMMCFIKYFIKEDWFDRELLNRLIISFPYVGVDAADKPCTIGLNGKKQLKKRLSGSAVQNWNFVRLFPMILLHGGVVIKPEDPVWQCYLKMKQIVESVFAPEASEEDVSKLEDSITEYLPERQRLFSEPLLPKHHFLRHYPALFRLLGPLIRLFTLRMESFHKVLKEAAAAGNNFINITFTMAHKLQLRKSFLSLGNLFADKVTYTAPRGYSPVWKEDEKEFIESLNLSPNSLCVNTVKLHGTNYQRGMWLVMECHEERLVLGQIIAMFCVEDVDFIVKKHDTSLEPNSLGLYEINRSDSGQLEHVSSATMGDHYPYQDYEITGRSFISLKYRPCLKKIRKS